MYSMGRGSALVMDPVDAIVQPLVLMHQAVPTVEPGIVKQHDDADLQRQQAQARHGHGEDVSEEGERGPDDGHQDGLIQEDQGSRSSNTTTCEAGSGCSGAPGHQTE